MPEISASKWMTQAGWNDVPHLTDDAKEGMLNATPEYLRDARSTGAPSLGAGAIYPIDWKEVTCKPFEIPEYWKRAYALDVGWRFTAALWQAWDPSSGEGFIYAEYKRGKQLPIIHAAAIKVRGAWIKGVIDPAAKAANQRDGESLFNTYKSEGLLLEPASTTEVESGLLEVWQDLSIGRLKFFSTLAKTHEEYRIYRRDEDGKVVKEHDHLMDDVRMLRRSGLKVARTRPVGREIDATSGVADRAAGY